MMFATLAPVQHVMSGRLLFGHAKSFCVATLPTEAQKWTGSSHPDSSVNIPRAKPDRLRNGEAKI